MNLTVGLVQIFLVSTKNQSKPTITELKSADLDQTRHKQAKNLAKTLVSDSKTLIVNVEWTLISNLI